MKLYAEEHGDGQPLLLITGLGYAIWSWQRQLPDWSKRFRCIAVENRGTGRSPKPPGPYSIEEMADDAAEALAGRRAHVAGFSMGGYIAQMVALRHPELVERLVLVCTATGGPDVVSTPAETRAAWEANARKTPPEFARATMPLSFRSSTATPTGSSPTRTASRSPAAFPARASRPSPRPGTCCSSRTRPGSTPWSPPS